LNAAIAGDATAYSRYRQKAECSSALMVVEENTSETNKPNSEDCVGSIHFLVYLALNVARSFSKDPIEPLYVLMNAGGGA
jgi:hypothetical protein